MEKSHNEMNDFPHEEVRSAIRLGTAQAETQISNEMNRTHNNKSKKRKIFYAFSSVAAGFATLIGSSYYSPALAINLSQLPIIGSFFEDSNKQPLFQTVNIVEVKDEEIKIPLNLEKRNIAFITGEARGVSAEPLAEGGYRISMFYPTNAENGELLVAQSINQYGNVDKLVNEMDTWYPAELGGYKKLNLAGITGVLNENDMSINTLHLITDSNIYTLSGEKTNLLLEVADEVVKEIK